jgi:spore cortex biosynthesis protein YabQ
MNNAITVELQFFLISVLWGAILLFVYDIFRILRRLIKHNAFFVAVQDLIFWVASSVFIFAMMYKENNGIIRGFSVMGMAIGMILYHYILSELFVNLITKFIQILFRPLVILFKQVKRIVHFVLSKCKKLSNFLLLRLKKITKSVKITLDKKKMKRIQNKNIRREKRAQEKKILAQKKLAEKRKKEQANQKKRQDTKNEPINQRTVTQTQGNKHIVKLDKINGKESR